ncbi:MAG TPA: 50S ribosomal protein L31e [archaeon]|nr:50S ribosomal protein L31e [archaeon]
MPEPKKAEAKKEEKKSEPLANEKIFTVPLRKAYDSQRTKRAKKAGTLLRQFLQKHMKSEEVKIGDSLNKAVWVRGIQKPPHKIRIHAVLKDGAVYAELLGAEIKPPTAEAAKKRAEKTAEKEKKIKERRKEMKKMSVQQELEKESGKVQPTETPTAPEAKEEKNRE